jgi:hypothetical protein
VGAVLGAVSELFFRLFSHEKELRLKVLPFLVLSRGKGRMSHISRNTVRLKIPFFFLLSRFKVTVAQSS